MSLTTAAIHRMTLTELCAAMTEHSEAMAVLSQEMLQRQRGRAMSGMRLVGRHTLPPVEAEEILALLNAASGPTMVDLLGRNRPIPTERLRRCFTERPAGRPRLRIVK